MADSKPTSGTRVPGTVSARPELIGRVLSERYRVDALIATGAFGAVYRGVHLHMRKQIAIKVLHPEIENFPELVHRFEREAVAGAHIAHPNVAAASDLGKFDGDSYFLVQEYVDGETLRALLGRGHVAPARAARIARQVAAALGAAHAKGILHRDLKPRNVMLVKDSDDLVKLIDFGFARVPHEMPQIADLEAPDWRKSDADIVFGTVAYLAPEASVGIRSLTEQSDLYALGVIVYELLAGQHPFDDDLPPPELFAQHRLTPPPPFSELDPPRQVPEALEAVVRRLLAKDPSDRFRDADEVIGALDEAMGDDPVYRETLGVDSIRAPARREPPRGERVSHATTGDRPWPRRRQLALAAAVALLLVGGLVAVTRATSRATPPAATPAAQSAAPLDPAPSAAPTAPSDEPLLVRKRAFIDLTPAGDIDEAAAALLDLVAVDAKALEDPTVQNAVVTLLARLQVGAASADKVFYALSYHAGPAGLDALYSVLLRFPSSYAARHAESTLTSLEDRESPALRITWALRQAECAKLPGLFERAGSDGDERTLVLLMAMHDPSCKMKRGQCCFRNNARLEKAIAKLKKD